MWLELMTGVPPCRLLIALKAMIPATATTCSKSTIKSARDSFMFGSDGSSNSAPDAVARARRRCPQFLFCAKDFGKLYRFHLGKAWTRRRNWSPRSA